MLLFSFLFFFLLTFIVFFGVLRAPPLTRLKLVFGKPNTFLAITDKLYFPPISRRSHLHYIFSSILFHSTRSLNYVIIISILNIHSKKIKALCKLYISITYILFSPPFCFFMRIYIITILNYLSTFFINFFYFFWRIFYVYPFFFAFAKTTRLFLEY